MKKSTVFIFAFVVLAASVVSAQTMKVVADKIVGQVGDRIILRSDISNALSDMRRQTRGQEGIVFPTECQILESHLIRKALVLQAEKDSIPVSEDEIDGILDLKIRQFLMAYGSKEMLEEIAGKTVYQIKEDNRMPIREQELAKQMQQKIVSQVKITPTEVKAYYNKISKDSLPYYESEVEVSQLVVQPKPNKDVDEYVSKQLYDYKHQVESGGGLRRFDQLAKSYSEDPAVKENGGQYTLNRADKGSWDPAFLSAAFKLKDGQVSPIIKTQFGLHIIIMVSRSGDEAVVKHILRIPPITDDEMKEASQKLESIRKQIMAGEITFGAAVNKYSDDQSSKYSAGSLSGVTATGAPTTFLSIDQLDKDIIPLLKDMKVGDYSSPQVFVNPQLGRRAVRIVYLKNRTTAHRENMADDYNRISQRALEEKKSGVLEKWFKEHIPTYYVNIDKEFSGCDGLASWRKAAVQAETARGFTSGSIE